MKDFAKGKPVAMKKKIATLIEIYYVILVLLEMRDKKTELRVITIFCDNKRNIRKY